MITKYNIMAECKESGNGKGNFKLALGALLATVGMGLANCNKSSAAEEQAKTPPAKELVLANADEAKDFATLSLEVQNSIRGKYDECIEDVKDFSKEGSGGSKEVEQILFDDGADDCDGMRKSHIRTAVAQKSIEETTRSITSGS